MSCLNIKGRSPIQLFEAVLWRIKLFCRRYSTAGFRKRNLQVEETWIEDTDSVHFNLNGADAKRILESYPEEHVRIRSEAEEVLSGWTEVPGFGRQKIEFNISGTLNAEAVYAHRLLMRLDFLRPIAWGNSLDGINDSYVDFIEKCLINWHDIRSRNDCFDSVDEAIRVLNLIETLALLQEKLCREAFKAGLCSILNAAWTIQAKRARAGNHLVYEGLALYYAGKCLQGYWQSENWVKLGVSILEKEMLSQVLPDGMHAELCTNYHLITGTNFLKAWVLAHKQEERFPDAFVSRLAKMAVVANGIKLNDDCFPALGDSDRQSGNNREEREGRAFAELGAILSQSEVIPSRSLHLAYLLGGSNEFPGAKTLGDADTTKLSAGGYHIIRNKTEGLLIFDAGPFGLPGMSHHGHADSLSLEMHFSGQRFLVDPGGFSYVDEAARAFARSTAAHNTIRVDGVDSSEVDGSFSFGRGAHAKLIQREEFEGGVLVCAEHDGYTSLRSPVIHRRALIWLTNQPLFLVVIDHLEGAGEHLVEAFFHADSCWDAMLSEKDTGKWNCENFTVSQTIRISCDVDVEIIKGEKEADWQGWVAPSYGKYQEAPVLVEKCKTPLPVDIVNLFVGSDKGVETPVKSTLNSVIIEDKLKLYWKWHEDHLSIDLK